MWWWLSVLLISLMGRVLSDIALLPLFGVVFLSIELGILGSFLVL